MSKEHVELLSDIDAGRVRAWHPSLREWCYHRQLIVAEFPGQPSEIRRVRHLARPYIMTDRGRRVLTASRAMPPPLDTSTYVGQAEAAAVGSAMSKRVYKAKSIDMVGQRFERLTVVHQDGHNKHCVAIWVCQCDCGNECRRTRAQLVHKSNPTKSCGCLAREQARERMLSNNPRRQQEAA